MRRGERISKKEREAMDKFFESEWAVRVFETQQLLKHQIENDKLISDKQRDIIRDAEYHLEVALTNIKRFFYESSSSV
jgi:hypothetical protein